MTRRTPVLVLALVFCLGSASTAYAQATTAANKPASTAAPSAAPAKWIAPMKGEGTIDVVKGMSRPMGKEMLTTLKIKNTSKGALGLLTVDEYWYSATGKDPISGDTQRHKALLNPGEIVEITMKSPLRPEMSRSLFMFRHANGTIKAKEVKKFVDPK